MKHPERAGDYLDHILEAMSRVADYLESTPTFSTFEQDRRNQDAVIRNIEIIGEAVSKLQKIAPDFITAHPALPWAQMRAMRNILAHQYFSVDLHVVWNTVTADFPRLKEQIGRLQRPD